MPSYPRKYILSDDCHFHITWQCHNKSWLLKEPWAKQLYYDLLLKFKDEYGVSVYSYNFMDSHPHLTGHGKTREGISNLMKRVNGIFARRLNKALKRRGQVVMDRFRSPSIESDGHLLAVMTYIDLNPVRAKMVKHPAVYRWSSYPYYAFGTKDPLITPAPSYLALSELPSRRQAIYQQMIAELIGIASPKRNYSTVYFIGNPDWVIERHRAMVRHCKRWKSRPRQQGPPAMGKMAPN